jgi:hypothetical protein
MVLACLELEEDFLGNGSGNVLIPNESLNQLATPYIAIECAGYVAPHTQPVSIIIEGAIPYQGSSTMAVLAIGSATSLTSGKLVFERSVFPYSFQVKRFKNNTGYLGEGFRLVLRFTELRVGGDTPHYFSLLQGVTVDAGQSLDAALRLADGESTSTTVVETFSYYPSFSMTLWLKLNSSSTPGVESVVFAVGTDDLGKQRRLAIMDDTVVGVAGNTVQVQSPGTLELGTWTHVAFTVNGINTYEFKMYVNGALVSTGSASNLPTWASSNTKFHFGMTGTTPDVSIRQVCAYSLTLDQTTIQSIYNLGFAGIGLIFATPDRIYVFNQIGEIEVLDESGNGGGIPLGNAAYEVA